MTSEPSPVELKSSEVRALSCGGGVWCRYSPLGWSWCSDIISAEGISGCLGAPFQPFCGLHEETSLGSTYTQSSELGSCFFTEVLLCLPTRLLLPQVPVSADVAAPALGLCSQPLLFSALQ